MNKKYVIFPLIALAVFIAYYWNFLNEYSAHEEAERIALEKKLEEKRIQDEKNRRIAYEEALKQQEINKKERERKRAEELKRKEDMDQMVRNREQALKEKDRLDSQLTRIKNNLEIEKATVERLKVMRAGLDADQESLKQYIVKANQNKQLLENLITQIEAREKELQQAAKKNN